MHIKPARDEVLRDFEKFHTFHDSMEAARDILKLLHERLGFSTWMVTVPDADKLEVLVCEDHGYNIRDGHIFRWQDTLCYRMVQGLAPNIAPCSNEIPAYKNAPIGQQVEISAYIGFPLVNADGNVYGTLCAIDPEPQPDNIQEEEEFILLQVRLLSTLMSLEQKEKFFSEELHQAHKRSLLDELTGIFNRRGWDENIAIEEERCQRYGCPAAVIIVDLDDLKSINDSRGHVEGDLLLQKTADCLKHVVRPFDIVARIGGDEFALLIIEACSNLTETLQNRIREQFKSANISASIGWGVRNNAEVIKDVARLASEQIYGNSLNDVMKLADMRMYQDKENRKQNRVSV